MCVRWRHRSWSSKPENTWKAFVLLEICCSKCQLEFLLFRVYAIAAHTLAKKPHDNVTSVWIGHNPFVLENSMPWFATPDLTDFDNPFVVHTHNSLYHSREQICWDPSQSSFVAYRFFKRKQIRKASSVCCKICTYQDIYMFWNKRK